jgi:hypothetical protein
MSSSPNNLQRSKEYKPNAKISARNKIINDNFMNDTSKSKK